MIDYRDHPIIDYIEDFEVSEHVLAAHGRGNTFLLLTKLEKPFERIDGKLANYEIQFRWLSKECKHKKDQAYVCVLGHENIFLNEDEFDLEKAKNNMFEAFRLFP